MESLPFLQGNLQYLIDAKEPVAAWLAGQRPDAAAVAERIFKNRYNMLDWRKDDGQGLFEVAPPQAFYKDWLPQDRPESSATFIVGCNLGYGLNHILVNTPNNHKIVVLEPRPEVLMACLGQTDFVPYFNIKKLFFLPPDKDMLLQAVQQADVQFLFGRIYLRPDAPSRQLGGEYALWTRLCKEAMESVSVELTTMRKRQDTMVGNELSNFRRAVADGSIRELEGSAKGLSAVILGAGPSLAQFAPGLAQAKTNALFATSLQTLPALQRLGVKPHLCMAIDYSKGMLKVFDRLDLEWCKDVPLLYSVKLDPEVVERYSGPTLPVWTLGGMASNVFRDKEHILDAAGNVSVALYRLLCWWGAAQVTLVGQDFAWGGGASHVEGHHAKVDLGVNAVPVKGRDGQALMSSLAYTTALRDLERDIASLHVPTFNLYGGGAVIHGAKDVDLDQAAMQGLFASAPGSLPRFLEKLDACRRPGPDIRFQARAVEWGGSLRRVQKRLEKLFKHPDKNSAEIRESLRQVYAFLRQDPLYLPYLYNEVMDVAGIIRARPKLELEDLTRFRNIVKRVLTKVRRMDQVLAHGDKAA